MDVLVTLVVKWLVAVVKTFRVFVDLTYNAKLAGRSSETRLRGAIPTSK